MVVRDARRPELDVVRQAGYDDPLGGPFEGSDDSVVVRFGDDAVDDDRTTTTTAGRRRDGELGRLTPDVPEHGTPPG